jgi:hypothetical protein
VTTISLWHSDGFSCFVTIGGERKPTYTVRVEHGDDVLREKICYSMETALARANAWRTQMATARIGATARSTPYDAPR